MTIRWSWVLQVRLIGSSLLYSESVNRRHLPYLSGASNPFDRGGFLQNWAAFLRPDTEGTTSGGLLQGRGGQSSSRTRTSSSKDLD